jgi:hypothetical protein
LIEYFGAISSENPEDVAQVMAAGFPILVHPGGKREALKKKADAPGSSQWAKERTDFTEMAIEHGECIDLV